MGVENTYAYYTGLARERHLASNRIPLTRAGVLITLEAHVLPQYLGHGLCTMTDQTMDENPALDFKLPSHGTGV